MKYEDKFDNFRLSTNAKNIEMSILPSGKFFINIKQLSKWEVLRENFTIEEIGDYLSERTKTIQAMNFFNN